MHYYPEEIAKAVSSFFCQDVKLYGITKPRLLPSKVQNKGSTPLILAKSDLQSGYSVEPGYYGGFQITGAGDFSTITDATIQYYHHVHSTVSDHEESAASESISYAEGPVDGEYSQIQGGCYTTYEAPHSHVSDCYKIKLNGHSVRSYSTGWDYGSGTGSWSYCSECGQESEEYHSSECLNCHKSNWSTYCVSCRASKSGGTPYSEWGECYKYSSTPICGKIASVGGYKPTCGRSRTDVVRAEVIY